MFFRCIIIFYSLLCILSPISAGELSIGGKATIYKPPEGGAGTVLVWGITARYRFNQYWSADASIEWTSYTDGQGNSYRLIPITANVIGHPFGKRSIDPYLGAGPGYYYLKVNNINNSSIGFQGLAGVRVSLIPGFILSVESKYIVPDARHPEKGGVATSFDIGGGISIRI